MSASSTVAMLSCRRDFADSLEYTYPPEYSQLLTWWSTLPDMSRVKNHFLVRWYSYRDRQMRWKAIAASAVVAGRYWLGWATFQTVVAGRYWLGRATFPTASNCTLIMSVCCRHDQHWLWQSIVLQQTSVHHATHSQSNAVIVHLMLMPNCTLLMVFSEGLTLSLHFYHAVHMHSTDYAVARCLSVHLSITCRYSVETVIHVLKVSSPSNIPNYSSFSIPNWVAIFQWIPLMGASNAWGVWKKSRFQGHAIIW